jgi:hypothetical protein
MGDPSLGVKEFAMCVSNKMEITGNGRWMMKSSISTLRDHPITRTSADGTGGASIVTEYSVA